MLFDTHIHLNHRSYRDDLDAVINRAKDAGVTQMTVIGFDGPSNAGVLELAEKHDNMYAVVGIHPSYAKTATDASWPLLKAQLQHPKVVAIGEMGFDYYHDTSFKDKQREVFLKQLEIARELDKPIVVHMRDATQDTYEVLKEHAQGLTGVLHCYSGSAEMLPKFLDLGFYIGFDGPVTFKNARKLHDVVKATPLDRIVLETDGPYLTPHPYRGKRNEPSYLTYIAEQVATLKGISYEEVAKATTKNAMRLYRISV